MTFPNPLLPGFNPDPSVVAVDGVYYLVTSTFEYLPGIPVYRSTDLTDWTHIGNVATRPEQARVSGVPTGGGVWAPTIRYRDGKQVVQVYAERPDSAVDRPVRWLVGFAPARVPAGETARVRLSVPTRLLAYWADGWRYEPGRYLLRAGTTVTDLPAAVTVELT